MDEQALSKELEKLYKDARKKAEVGEEPVVIKVNGTRMYIGKSGIVVKTFRPISYFLDTFFAKKKKEMVVMEIPRDDLQHSFKKETAKVRTPPELPAPLMVEAAKPKTALPEVTSSLKCSEHPLYNGIRKPKRSKHRPKPCPSCLAYYASLNPGRSLQYLFPPNVGGQNHERAETETLPIPLAW